MGCRGQEGAAWRESELLGPRGEGPCHSVLPCPTVGLARAAAGEGVGAPGQPHVALSSPQPEVGVPGLSLPPAHSILMHGIRVCGWFICMKTSAWRF